MTESRGSDPAPNPPLPAAPLTTSSAASGHQPTRSLSTIGLGVIAAVMLVATMVFAAKWVAAKGNDNDRSAVASASGRFAERFLTLDSRAPERTERAVVPLATGAFRRTFQQGFEAGLVPALVAIGKVQTVASVKEVFIGDLDSNSAHVIVHVGVVAHPVDQPKTVSTRPDSWIELDLVKQRGRWLVDGVGDLKIGSESQAEPGPTGPGTTVTTVNPGSVTSR